MDLVSRRADDVVRAYIEAFEARDLLRCMRLFTDDAVVEFAVGTFHGKQELENWHTARFAANLTVLRIDGVTVEDSTVTVKGAITSDRAKKWRLDVISGHATFQMRAGKIVHMQLSL